MEFLKSAPGNDPVEIESYFAASPERVFRAWTTPDEVKEWFGYRAETLVDAEIDLKPGGAWRFIISNDPAETVWFEGAYQTVEVAKTLIFSWNYVVTKDGGRREATPHSSVHVTFTAKGSGTLLRIVHSGLSTEDIRKGVGGGWNAAMGSLQNVVQT